MPMLAVAALGAAATGIAVSAGVALATAVSYVGIGMTVVGKITGNQNMMKVGGIMGLAGGVMNLANIGTAASSAAGAGSLTEAAAADAASGSEFWADVGQKYGDVAGSGVESITQSSFSSLPEIAAVDTAAPSLAAGPSGGLLNAQVTPQAVSGAGYSTSAPINPLSFEGSTTPQVGSSLANNLAVPANSAPVAQTQTAQSGGDKESWWKSLPESSRNEIIRAGFSGASKFFEGWSQSEINDFKMKREQELQTNLNAQPNVGRYQAPKGLLGATQLKVG